MAALLVEGFIATVGTISTVLLATKFFRKDARYQTSADPQRALAAPGEATQERMYPRFHDKFLKCQFQKLFSLCTTFIQSPADAMAIQEHLNDIDRLAGNVLKDLRVVSPTMLNIGPEDVLALGEVRKAWTKALTALEGLTDSVEPFAAAEEARDHIKTINDRMDKHMTSLENKLSAFMH